MVTQARAWKSNQKTGDYELSLPSGNVALCRPIRPEAFLENGLIPEPMTALVTQAINSKRGLPPNALNKIASDPKQLASAMEMFDRALVFCVIEPQVEMPPLCMHTDAEHPEPCGYLYTSGEGVHINRKHADYHRFQEEPRDGDILYADDVDMEDKQFIFQWAVGGHSDVERFRREHAAAMGSLAQG